MLKTVKIDDLPSIRDQFSERKIALCHGVFDVFHFGHLQYLQAARAMADVLVVTLTTDRFVNKGPHRPYHKQDERAEILASLDFVDFVAINPEPTGVNVIEMLKPDFYVKGSDYKAREQDTTGGILEEEDAVIRNGGQLRFTNDPLKSSTKIINHYLGVWDTERKEALDRIRENFDVSAIINSIDQLHDTRVLVIGEPIIDTYSYCKPEALSSKSPTISAKHMYHEDYAGGSLAIANNLAKMGCEVGLLGVFGDEEYVDTLLSRSLDERIKLERYTLRGIPTPRKTRYLQQFSNQKIFEITDIRHDQWLHHSPEEFCKTMEKIAKDYDLIICADFGHGLFEGEVLECLYRLPNFIATNVQTNSSNLGFNPFTKHRRYDYLSIDERELRLGMHDRFMNAQSLASKARCMINAPYSITLGDKGSVYFPAEGDAVQFPVFLREIVDTTGAGDAYFLISSLMVYHKQPDSLIPFVGNCYAGLAAQIVGNKYSNSIIDLQRTIKSLVS